MTSPASSWRVSRCRPSSRSAPARFRASTSLTLEPRLLFFSLVVASLSAVGFGLAPALRAARTQPGDVLREQSRATTSGGAQMRLRQWLVVSQVALAFVLLVGAGLLIASFQRLRQVPLGVRPEGVLAFELHLPDARYDSTARARVLRGRRRAFVEAARCGGRGRRLEAPGDWRLQHLGYERADGPTGERAERCQAWRRRIGSCRATTSRSSAFRCSRVDCSMSTTMRQRATSRRDQQDRRGSLVPRCECGRPAADARQPPRSRSSVWSATSRRRPQGTNGWLRLSPASAVRRRSQLVADAGGADDRLARGPAGRGASRDRGARSAARDVQADRAHRRHRSG